MVIYFGHYRLQCSNIGATTTGLQKKKVKYYAMVRVIPAPVNLCLIHAFLTPLPLICKQEFAILSSSNNSKSAASSSDERSTSTNCTLSMACADRLCYDFKRPCVVRQQRRPLTVVPSSQVQVQERKNQRRSKEFIMIQKESLMTS